MKKGIPVLAALLCCILLTSCSRVAAFYRPLPVTKPIALSIQDAVKSNNALEFTAFLEEVNSRNQSIDAPTDDLTPYLYDNEANIDKMYTNADLAEFSKSYDAENKVDQLLQEEAVDDAQWLFRTFRTVYGLYQLYGGDMTFGDAESAVLEELNQVDTISTTGFNRLLYDNLSFIEDCHLSVGNFNFRPEYRTYVALTSFVKTDEGFYDASNNKYILSIDGMPPETYLRRSISPGGRLSYQYAFVSKTRPAGKLLYADGTSGVLHLTILSGERTPPEDFSFTVVDGIPVIRLDSMPINNGTNSKVISQFVSSARKIKDYPAAIIDLRNNSGGDAMLCDRWFEAYTGEKQISNFEKLSRNTLRPNGINGKNAYYKDNNYIKINENYYRSMEGTQFLENDGPVLFILISSRSASATEYFTDAMRNLSNTVVVGTNSSGALTADLTYPMHRLPKSGLLLNIGTAYFRWDPSYFQEGKGLEPDLWLTGSNEQEQLLSFVKRYVTEKRM